MGINSINCLPLVTIVTPSFNQGRFIRETIESVLAQDYPNIEYMVVDGCSRDETLDILKEYGERICWISEKDNGQTEAINKGWKMGNGQIFAWLNSDDTYLPGAVTNAVAFLKANPNAMLVYGEGWHIKEDGEIIERYPTEPFNLLRLAETCYICQPTVFLRKKLLDEIGYLDESLNYCMDYDLWIRAAKRYPLSYIDKYLAKSRLYAATKTISQQVDVCREVMETMHRHFNIVALPWIHAYCSALLENKYKRDSTVQEVIYLILFARIYLKNYLKYNKKITKEARNYFTSIIRKYINKLWTKGGAIHAFY
jgi:glycosyltransferase involved in cell wall biosynthesis